MRRYLGRGLLGAFLATATLLVVSGCSKLPAGADGDLDNQWPAMAAPIGWTPEAGKCAKDFAENTTRAAYSPVDCTSTHYFETLFKGEFTGDAAKLPSPPKTGDPELAAAWADCDGKTREFLGDDWRNGRLWIGVSVPSHGAWGGGARWYTCQIGVLTRVNGDNATLDHSLKGEFTKESALRVGCFVKPADENSESTEVPCTTSHDYEFAGTFVSPISWDQLQDYDHTKTQIHSMCRSTIAKYVGVPDDGNMRYRTGTSVQYPSKDDWDSGDHSIRCYLWSPHKVSRSLKGAGSGGLPIQYA